MIASHATAALDNPFWSSLVTRHAHLAQGGALARRYPPAISRIAALPGDTAANVAALESLVAIGEEIGTAGPFVPALPSQLGNGARGRARPDGAHRAHAAAGRGLRRDGARRRRRVGDAGARRGREAGTLPPRTIELGTYFGIRENGRLVAMAGERTWVGNCREVSAVCTHPGAEGRGFARALVARVVNRMLRAGETAFLHVRSNNTDAYVLYRSLGFVPRVSYPILYARRAS